MKVPGTQCHRLFLPSYAVGKARGQSKTLAIYILEWTVFPKEDSQPTVSITYDDPKSWDPVTLACVLYGTRYNVLSRNTNFTIQNS